MPSTSDRLSLLHPLGSPHAWGPRARLGLLAIQLLLTVNCSGCAQFGNRSGAGNANVLAEPERVRYVKATIEVGCLSRKLLQPEDIANRTNLIYHHYGFEPGNYLELVASVGQDKSVQQEIEDGLKSCP